MTPAHNITFPCPTCGHKMTTVNGLYLKELREAAHLTQSAFGAAAGISSPYVSDIERNRRRCPPHILKAYQLLQRKKRR